MNCHVVTDLISYYSFVDRDMFMRYRGGGIGHKITRDWDDILHAEGRHDPPEDPETSDDSEEDELNEDNVPGDEECSGDSDNEGIDMDAEADVGKSQFEHGARGISDGVDNVVADDGEELDEMIWDEEGYDAL